MNYMKPSHSIALSVIVGGLLMYMSAGIFYAAFGAVLAYYATVDD